MVYKNLDIAQAGDFVRISDDPIRGMRGYVYKVIERRGEKVMMQIVEPSHSQCGMKFIVAPELSDAVDTQTNTLPS